MTGFCVRELFKTLNICMFIFISRRVLKYEKFEPPPVSSLSSTSLSKSPEFDALPDLNMDLVRAHHMFSRIMIFQLVFFKCDELALALLKIEIFLPSSALRQKPKS